MPPLVSGVRPLMSLAQGSRRGSSGLERAEPRRKKAGVGVPRTATANTALLSSQASSWYLQHWNVQIAVGVIPRQRQNNHKVLDGAPHHREVGNAEVG